MKKFLVLLTFCAMFAFIWVACVKDSNLSNAKEITTEKIIQERGGDDPVCSQVVSIENAVNIELCGISRLNSTDCDMCGGNFKKFRFENYSEFANLVGYNFTLKNTTGTSKTVTLSATPPGNCVPLSVALAAYQTKSFTIVSTGTCCVVVEASCD